ncbi:helix-turn-helix transcriptional regulator [Endozoicomonas sp. 8E]|uniref:helix-turn-helix transcriptional regulator n=1 Tax=Endozoicomonas sp. 8E TaxID=3035692 RepID=UPI003977600C
MTKETYHPRQHVLTRYKISNTTLYRWIKSGRFPAPARFSSRCIRWSESSLQKWEQSLG